MSWLAIGVLVIVIWVTLRAVLKLNDLARLATARLVRGCLEGVVSRLHQDV